MMRARDRMLWMVVVADVVATYVYAFAANALMPPRGPHAPPSHWLTQAWVYGLIAPVAAVATWRGVRQVRDLWAGRANWWRLTLEGAAVGAVAGLLLPPPAPGRPVSTFALEAVEVVAVTGGLGLLLTMINYPLACLLSANRGAPVPAD